MTSITMAELRQELQRYATKDDLHRELQHFATKEDLAKVETRIATTETRIIKWVIGSVFGTFVGAGTLGATVTFFRSR